MNRNQIRSFIAIALLLTFSLTAISSFAQDDRINAAHHYGGDALYCDQAQGCWLFDSEGNLLWEVPQSTIDTIMTEACETGHSMVIEAGQGTHGPSFFNVSCYVGFEPGLTYVGFDEHGNRNDMLFAMSYESIVPPAPVVEVTPEPVVVAPPVVAPPPPVVVGVCSKVTPQFCGIIGGPVVIGCGELKCTPIIIREDLPLEQVEQVEQVREVREVREVRSIPVEISPIVVSESKISS